MPAIDLSADELQLVLKALASHDNKLTEDFEEAQFWAIRLGREGETTAAEAQQRYVAKVEAEEAMVETLTKKLQELS